jgi:hypothetical protein
MARDCIELASRDVACRQQQAVRGSSTRLAAGAAHVMAAAGGKGKALISVSDKTGLDTLAKVQLPGAARPS